MRPLNLALALWNGHDDRLKERLFGLTNSQGNHGEDAKEFWWHIDATPTHSYAEYLYRYPQAAFPYAQLVEEGGKRGKSEPEYELGDTGVLADDRFFDVTVVHAKEAADDIVVEYHIVNHGPETAPLDVVPQLWFRNTWVWGRDERRPAIARDTLAGLPSLTATHAWLGTYHLVADDGPGGAPRFLLCDNETNVQRVFGPDAVTEARPQPAHPKDAIDDAIVHGDESLLAADTGTKAAIWWHLDAVAPGAEVVLRLRLMSADAAGNVGHPFGGAEDTVDARQHESDAFYATVIPDGTSDEDAFIARRAFAGLLWCKQLYRYSVREWLEGDPNEPEPPASRLLPGGRNVEWTHVALADVISMPDEWEYPWFASWDLAFHATALAHIDPWFAKEQLVLMCREWCEHPTGQLAAYEWKFSDVNPPVLAWAARNVYFCEGGWDKAFLVRVFTKLIGNFGWWVNKKDSDSSNLYEGGFLGMDNIGLFDRSAPLPEGQRLEQSDATSWMAFYALCMLKIAVELAADDQAWDEIATKYLEHYLMIADAMDAFGSSKQALWDDSDGFYYDVIVDADGAQTIKVRSMVGLLPLLGVMNLPSDLFKRLPDLKGRLAWLRERRPELNDAMIQDQGAGTTLSVVTLERLRRILTRMLDPGEFLSDHGIRALSAVYRGGVTFDVPGRGTLGFDYQPARAPTGCSAATATGAGRSGFR